MGGGSKDVHLPGPSKEEKALRAQQSELLGEQTKILREQAQFQKMLAPILLKDAGVDVEFNDAGDIVGFNKQDDGGLHDLRQEIELGFLKRSKAALDGELPENPALLRDLAKQEEGLHNRLLAQLGPGFETSTPGIEALGDFDEREAVILEGARRGDLTLAESLGIARQGGNQASTASDISNIHGITGMSQRVAQGFGQAASGFNAPIAGLAQDRSLQLQAAINSENRRLQSRGQIFSAAGQIAGAGVLGFMSS